MPLCVSIAVMEGKNKAKWPSVKKGRKDNI